jgi:gas vesicle protein GvpL/GvpF
VSAGEQRADAATYVYGVVSADDAPEITAPAIGGEKSVRSITSGGLTALVSDVAGDFVRATREDLQRHMAVLEEAAAATTVVPLRFGTVMPGDDVVRAELLDARAEEVRGMLGRLDGRIELSLNGTYQEEVLGEVVDEDREVAALRARVRERDEAATYYERIRLGELVAGAMAAKREHDTERVLAKLRPLADDVHLGELTHERSVLSAAFLVRRDRLEEFDRAAEEVARQHRDRIRFRYAGPLPPFDFVGAGEGGPWG